MEGYETAREAATRLDYEYTYLTRLLKEGRIPGAIKWQDRWMVPANVRAEDVKRHAGRPSVTRRSKDKEEK